MPPYPILVLSIELHVVAIKDVLLLFKSHYDMSNSACSQLKSDYSSRVFSFRYNFFDLLKFWDLFWPTNLKIGSQLVATPPLKWLKLQILNWPIFWPIPHHLPDVFGIGQNSNWKRPILHNYLYFRLEELNRDPLSIRKTSENDNISTFSYLSGTCFSISLDELQPNLMIRDGLIITNLLHKDKEHLASGNNIRVTKKFLITKFDCTNTPALLLLWICTWYLEQLDDPPLLTI